jgi:hypothetical protein
MLQVLFGIFRLKEAKIAWQDAFPRFIGRGAPIQIPEHLWYYSSKHYTAITWENMITYHLIELLLEISDHPVTFSLRN